MVRVRDFVPPSTKKSGKCCAVPELKKELARVALEPSIQSPNSRKGSAQDQPAARREPALSMSSQDGAENPLDQTQVIEFVVDISNEEEFPPLQLSASTSASQAQSEMSERNRVPPVPQGVQSAASSGRSRGRTEGGNSANTSQQGAGASQPRRSNQGASVRGNSS